MDYSSVLKDLEEACADFQVPSTRFAAEQRLQEFRKRPDAIQVGKYVLGNSSVPTAQFFGLRGIKDAVIESYAVIGLEETLNLRNELFELAQTSKGKFESFVVDSLCWVVAVITKRAWIESTDEQRSGFIGVVCDDIIEHKSPCIGIMTAAYVIDEFAGGSRCSEFHLPWEFHYGCKSTFENTHMMRLMEAALKVLHNQIQQAVEGARARGIIFEKRSALHIVERVLSWEFTSADSVISASFGYSKAKSERRTGDSDDESEQVFLESEDQGRTPAFPSVWRELLVNPQVIALLFSIYEAANRDQMHAHFSPGSSRIALQCLVQISGLRGKELFSGPGENSAANGDSARAEYASVVMRNQLQIIRSVCSTDLATEAGEDDVMCVTQMIRRFIETQIEEPTQMATALGDRLHPLAFLVLRVPETLEFFSEVSQLICALLRGVSDILKSDMARNVDDDFGDVDNNFVMQAFDELANAWSAVIGDIREWEELESLALETQAGESNGVKESNRSALHSLLQFLNSTSFMVRSEYTRLRMLACEIGGRSRDGDSEDSVADHGMLEKDYVVYEDQLQFYAMLARLDTRLALERAHVSLREKCAMLQTEFARADDGDAQGDAQQAIDILHDQINWLVLIVAYIFADSGTSERVLIPRDLMQCSLSCSSPEDDDVVRLPMLLLEILEFELISPSSARAALCSPLLVETLFWTLQRLVPVYFFPDSSDYRAISPSIAQTFGAEGSGPSIMQGILGLVRRAFDLWSAEEDVLNMCTSMLLAFAQRSRLAVEITHSPLFTPLVVYLTSNLSRYPEVTHSSIVQAFAVLACHSAPDARDRSLDELKSLVLLNITHVVFDPSFKPQCYDGRIVAKLLDGLEMMDGMLSAASFQNMAMLFELFFEVDPLLKQLLTVYSHDHSVLVKVLQIVESSARYLDVSALPDDERRLRFSQCIRSTLLKYHTVMDGRSTYEVGADMDLLLEVRTLMSTVSSLIHNEMGSSPNEASSSMSSHVADDYGETEIFGLYCIHTTTTPSQLLAPSVMRGYMQLLSEIIQYRIPSLIRWLPATSWKALFNMLIEGIDHDIYDVGRRTYEALCKLGAFIKLASPTCMSDELQGVFREDIVRVLNKLLRALLFSPFDAELVESAGTAMITLGLINPAHLQSCFNDLLAMQARTPEFRRRLAEAFARFNANVEGSVCVARFLRASDVIPLPIDSEPLRKPLFEFLVNTRAILRVR